MAKWISLIHKGHISNGFLLTKQEADDMMWLIELALSHVTLNPKTKRRLSTIRTLINKRMR